MALLGSGRRASAVLAVCAGLAFAGMSSAQASVFTATSDALPLLGFPYTIPGGTCFTTAGFCVAGGEFTLTSLVPSGFVQNPSDEDITTNAADTVEITNLSHVLVATVTLTGKIEQDVVDRADENDTGSWTVDLVSVALSGSLGGVPLTVTLDPGHTSSGTTSITPDGQSFRVDSFFDVFAEVTYDLPTGTLTAFPSGTATVGAPEPATLALLAAPLLAMVGVRRRRG
jgi:hypothetical protein